MLYATGMEENKVSAQKGGKIAREAREKLELQTGQKVVTDNNFLPASKKPKQIKKTNSYLFVIQYTQEW